MFMCNGLIYSKGKWLLGVFAFAGMLTLNLSAQGVKSLNIGDKYIYDYSDIYKDFGTGSADTVQYSYYEEVVDTTSFWGHTYAQIFRSNPPSYFFERTDSIGIYSFAPSADTLTYDYSSEVGDTIYYINAISNVFKPMKCESRDLSKILGDMQEDFEWTLITQPSRDATLNYSTKFGKHYYEWKYLSSQESRVVSFQLRGAILRGIIYGDTVVTGLVADPIQTLNTFTLYDNYSNPLNNSTVIKYELQIPS